MKWTYWMLAVALSFSACSRTEEDDKSTVAGNLRGEWIDERAYANDYFGISVRIPEDWHLDKGASQHINEMASDFLGGEDENLKATLKSAIDKTYTVFWAYRYPPGTPGKTNPNVSMIIENLAPLPGVKSGSDYLLRLQDTFKLTGKEIHFLNEPIEVEIGGAPFWMRDVRMPLGATEIKQKYYATMKDRHVLMFSVTMISDGDDEIVSELTDTIKKK